MKKQPRKLTTAEQILGLYEPQNLRPETVFSYEDSEQLGNFLVEKMVDELKGEQKNPPKKSSNR